ncbi:MAG TPA: S66 peptidase family protein [Cryptosporangiaceae bacterium]|nr:S66 peptidase family protein [Cryptosporangiaceae bacterium]
MKPQLPPRLRAGDQLRVIAPSQSMERFGSDQPALAARRLEKEYGLTVTYGDHVWKDGPLGAASVDDRVADMHAAFTDPDVAGILAVTGGFNSNQLLPYLDYDLIAAHPKVFCGYSDITALNHALLARANLVTYSGPHFSTFAMRDHLEGTIDAFHRCLFTSEPVRWAPSPYFTDDDWYEAQDDRRQEHTDGWWVLQPGTASGQIVGANLCTLNLLQGTPYQPPLTGAVLFVEDDYETDAKTFDRDLTSLLQAAGTIRGLVVGRFQQASDVGRELLTHIVSTKRELTGLPVLANVDFGHTNPLYTFPIGGECWIAADPGAVEIVLTRH